MMNLTKLFETQKVLRDRIGYNEPDRFEKLILALLVELGECANEWRGFKFWSKNQQPRTKASRNAAMMEEDKEYYNPLLEEFIDKLHFILELGLEVEVEKYDYVWSSVEPVKWNDVTKQFIQINKWILKFEDNPCATAWRRLFAHFLGLGEMLGFTWEEVETAYFEKNKINHQRQQNGY